MSTKTNLSRSGRSFTAAALLFTLTFLLPAISHAQLLRQEGNKLVGSGAIGNADQGQAVAISADGNTAIVGGRLDNSNIGAVWFYIRTGNTWSQQGPKIIGTDAVGQESAGISVSISADGNTAVFGGYTDNSPLGAAWVFTRSAGVWTQQGPKLVGTGSINSPLQGWSVAISGDGNTILSGGQLDNAGTGAVWAFTRSGGVWTQQGPKLVGSGTVDVATQGYSVALSYDGNTAIEGGIGDNNNIGAAWIFTRTGSTWSEAAKLVATDYTGSSYQGQSVSISGDGNTAIVGGYLNNSSNGAAWIYTRAGGSWTQEGPRLFSNDNTGLPQFGSAVSLSYDGNRALIGGTVDNSSIGAAWLFTRAAGTWSQAGAKLLPLGNSGSARLGNSACISADGNTGIVGGFNDNAGKGAAWIFSACNGNPPKAAISGAPAGVICGGYSLSVTDTSTVNKIITAYSWSDGSTTASSNLIFAPGTYTVTITNSCGNSSTVSQVITTVNASPAPVITGGNYYCEGSSIILTVTDAAGTAGPLSYSWSNGSSTNTSNPISTPGVYTASITNGDGCTATSSQTIASYPVTVNATGGVASVCYPSLKAAFDAVNNGVHSGDISILIFANTTETAPCTLNASGSGAASYSSLLINPAGGAARTVSGTFSLGGPMINLNGANHVVIDGLNNGGNALTLANLSTATVQNTSTIRFANDASNNRISNCSIIGNSGATVATAAGTVIFTAGTVTGNDNDTLSYCNINSSGTTTLATKHIYAGGTPGMENDGLLIDHNNISNYYRNNLSAVGIDINNYTNGVTISNNKFYQSATRIIPAPNLFQRAISINTPNDGAHRIINNTIGFADSTGAGVTGLNFTGTSTTASFVPIWLTTAPASTPVSVQGNTISGITILGLAAGTGTTAPFRGIYVASGPVNIGGITGNTIGSMSATGSILFNLTTASAADFIGISVNGTDNATISNNNIGGISCSTNNPRGFYGIRLAGSTNTYTCDSNKIGGSIASSILIGGTGALSKLRGIEIAGGSGSFTNNTIRNMATSGGTGTDANAALAGIYTGGTGNQVLSRNNIYNLVANASVAELTGLLVNNSGTNLVERNAVYNLGSPSVNVTTINGLKIISGTGSCQNNMIALGTGIPLVGSLRGIYRNTNPTNMLHNSVFLGGNSTLNGTVTSYGFYAIGQAGSIRDNIFFNARTNTGAGNGQHFAAGLSTTSVTIDNNLYYNTGAGSSLGQYNGSPVADLTAWKAATAQDAASLFGNPYYTAPTAATPDLRINAEMGPSLIDATGADLGIIDDFDGQQRALLTPTDIGANAFKANKCRWLGTVDTQWSNPANWSCAVLPTATTIVTIPVSATRMPVVDIPGATCYSIFIEPGAAITISDGNELKITGP